MADKLEPCRWCEEEKPLFEIFAVRVVANGKAHDAEADRCCLKCATTQVVNMALDAYLAMTKEAVTA